MHNDCVLEDTTGTKTCRENLPFKEQVEHLFWAGKAPVSGQEDVDIGTVYVPGGTAQVLHQSVQATVLNDPDLLQTPLQEGTLVIGILCLYRNNIKHYTIIIVEPLSGNF